MAVVGEKAVEVNGEGAVLIFLKADGFNEAFGLLVGNIADKGSEMHAAQVNKVKCTSAQHEKCFKVKGICGGCEVVNKSPFIGELELTNASQLTVNGS